MNNDFKDKINKYLNNKLSEEEEGELEEVLEMVKKVNEDISNKVGSKKGRESDKNIIKKVKIKAWLENIVVFISIIIAIGVVGVLSYSKSVLKTEEKVLFAQRYVPTFVQSIIPNVQIQGEGALDRRRSVDVDTFGKTADSLFSIGTTIKGGEIKDVKTKGLIPLGEKDMFIKPDIEMPNEFNEIKMLKDIPRDTMVEAYVSFNNYYDLDNISEILGSVKYRVNWISVKVSEDTKAPLMGFSTYDAVNMCSYTKGEYKKYFKEIIDYLNEDSYLFELLCSQSTGYYEGGIGGIKSYIEKNGVKTYGAVIKGSPEELIKLGTNKNIRSIKIKNVKYDLVK